LTNWNKKLLLFVIASTLCLNLGIAQEAKYKVDIVYRLSKHFTWPENADDGKFVIGVLGSEKDFKSFQVLESKNWGHIEDPIEVRYFENDALVDACDILYVSRDYSLQIKGVIKKTKNQPVLIISDEKGYGELGAVINFVDGQGKLKFELNEGQADKRGLQVSEKLKKIAILI